jgi:hypothetical protein
VQLGSRALEHPPVGGIADEYVMEAQNGLAEEPPDVGLDELAAAERLEARVEIADVPRQELCDGGARELPADDRRTLEHGALLRSEPLDARREERLDRRWHLEGRELHAADPAIALALERSILDEHPHELADEEWIPFARREHATRNRGGQRIRADHIRRELGCRAGVEPPERHHVGDERAGHGQRRAQLAQLGPRRDQDEQRHAGAPLDEVLREVEQQRLGPLQVVDHEHDRSRRGDRGEEATDDEERLFGRRGRAGDERGDAVGDARGLVAGNDRGDRCPDGVASGPVFEVQVRAQGRRERGERCAAGGIAVRRQHRRAVTESPRELGEEARFAEPGRAEDHREPRARRGDRRVVDRDQPTELVVAPDERGCRRACGTLEGDDAVRRHAFGAALEREGADGREGHEIADEPLRRLADQYLALLRLLLEPRCHVQWIANAGRVLVAGHDLAGVDGDTQPDVADDRALLAGELAERMLDADGRPHGADRVVLGDARHAEGAHDAVAEELHDGAAMRLDRDAHGPVVAVHHAAHGLGIEPLVQRGRSHEIGEHDRDHLAHDRVLGRREGAGGEWGSAAPAELRRRRARAPARRAAPL